MDPDALKAELERQNRLVDPGEDWGLPHTSGKLTFRVFPEQRKVVQEALREARLRNGQADLSVALVDVCQGYLDGLRQGSPETGF